MDVEDAFFDRRAREAPPRREPALLRRSPAIAALALVAAGWLLWSLAPDVAWYFSSRDPIDLGGPGAWRLQAARENRLAQISGPFAEALPVTEGAGGEPRTVGRIAGTSVLVDRPGRTGPPVYEGRLLPARDRAAYAGAAAALRARGAPLADGWLVLRDGDRPRQRVLPVLGAALLVAVCAINLRALARTLLSSARSLP